MVTEQEILTYAQRMQAEDPERLTVEKTVDLLHEVPHHVLRAAFDMMETLRESLPDESERGLFYTAINAIEVW